MRTKTKITPEIISKVIGLLNRGYSQVKITKEIGISNGTVSAIKLERQRILNEAKNGNTVKADVSNIEKSNKNSEKWITRRSRFTKHIKDVLDISTEKTKSSVITEEVKKEFSSININYKGININVTEDIKSISFGKDQIVIN